MVRPAPRPISLALQGGGAHGAFTWGVLDALLEDGRLDIRAITATSAGAMNACALAMGRVEGGSEGARAALERFWRAVSRIGGPFRTSGSAQLFPLLDAFSRMISPYNSNPFDYDPLRDILSEQIDFAMVHACRDTALFIAATCVETGRARIFSGEDITLDAVRASATLPFINQAVEIEGRPYWDGGFTGNPALWPLFYTDAPGDLLIVHINPMLRAGTPKTAAEIIDRVSEVTFNAGLLAELRAIAFVKRLHDEDMLTDAAKHSLRNPRVHAIRADTALNAYPASTKYDTSWRFLTALKDKGRQAGFDWLTRCAHKVGEAGTVDLKAEFLDA
jgi:NTE family protein